MQRLRLASEKALYMKILKSKTLFSGLLLALVLTLLLAGCARWPVTRRIHPPQDVDRVEGIQRVGIDPAPEYEYRLGVGDSISIRFFFYPDMIEPRVEVPSTGTIQMPLVGPLQVIGLTESELNALLREEYSRRLLNPDVVARITTRSHGGVFLDGAVPRVAQIPYDSPLTLLGVLKTGNMAPTGVLRSIVVIRNLNSPEYMTFRVDARKILDGKMHDIYLQPDDIVYVPTKFILDVNYFVARYIDGVLGRHIGPAQIFPQPFPFKGQITYDLNIGLQDIEP